MRAPRAAERPSAEELMAGTDKRKQSLYFPEDMLREIQEEANRQDRFSRMRSSKRAGERPLA